MAMRPAAGMSGPTIAWPCRVKSNGRWRADVVLKRDVFSTVERGRFRARGRRGRGGAAPARRSAMVDLAARASICSRASAARWRWLAGSAWRRALLFAGRRVLVRGWIDGVPLHIAKPHGDAGYFRSAKAALRKLHRAGCHAQRSRQGAELAARRRQRLSDRFPARVLLSARRSALFRIARYEDLRHLLKHKRRYAPEALTRHRAARAGAQEPADADLDGDRQEGLLRDHARPVPLHRPRRRRQRLVHDAPVIAARLQTHPQVRDVVIVAYPDRRAGTGLYAFVEGSAGARRPALREFVTTAAADRPSICR